MVLGGVWLKRKHVCFLLISQRCMQVTTSALTLARLLPTRRRRCYEVRCDLRSQVIDGYGNPYDRSSACKAGSASVVVRTVDNCECGCGLAHGSSGAAGARGCGVRHVQAGVPARLPVQPACSSYHPPPASPPAHLQAPATTPPTPTPTSAGAAATTPTHRAPTLTCRSGGCCPGEGL